MHNFIIETERMILRPIRIEDAQDVFEWASDPEVNKYIHLHCFDVVTPIYIDVEKQKFELTKLGDLQVEMDEIKEQISLMKKSEIVTVESMLKKGF